MLLYLMLSASLIAKAQQGVPGSWQGQLQVPGQQIPIVLHVHSDEDGVTATFDSPDQGAFGIPFATAELDGSKLRCTVPSMALVLEVTLQNDTLYGLWKQGGAALPLTMHRMTSAEALPSRPQIPKPPFPYKEVVHKVQVNSDVTIEGTLTLPEGEGPFPAIVLLSGSGPQNRNCEFLGHQPFLVLSDYLSRNGIAVFRYDDRGVGASTGNFAMATSADFANDAGAAFDFLKGQPKIATNRVGLLGLSEGGMIGPMVVARKPDAAFVVMLAGPAIRGRELLLAQTEALAGLSGQSPEEVAALVALNTVLYDYVISKSNADEVAQDWDHFSPSIAAEAKRAGINQEALNKLSASIASPWVHYFLSHDPKPALAAVRCPALALYGGKDVQVPAAINAPVLETIFAESGAALTLKIFPNCNHIFQNANTGAIEEYATIEETMSPEVMAFIASWVHGH